ncbi:MAG: winged helix-turn-helix domain-containing protein [Gammaproteobacteria bacterium]|jgi:hypothetical protein|nr:winged helix-turn-helix domain-containing protein [Gammaproteobacteria bacterium]MBT3860651.1 winged helix-turn-helix domain-containing protein [Gammaproteobacteria bacterium]MBT3988788.1 winged helix-turn-helix domain-containing protein [Gammaproteobacteria bacterium]MBT4254901.1 winged helix-turn-helix domain-containing protein [Gammaproteobacteria bacterium]MBT4582651.1 winged helix-turn-helix domain-containing protein [Gammaproteobacteria bacterium]
MTISLSSIQARKIALQCQGLYQRNSFGKGLEATAKVIDHLGYVQLDTLSVVARAHLHTLWNRVDGFRPDHIDSLQQKGEIFEYWAHALSLLPMKDYRFALPRMNRIARGEVHWYQKNSKQAKHVMKRIKEEGALSSKDFDDKAGSKNMWSRSPSKQALEQLFMEGELMIPRRVNFHKVYDLRERVLPEGLDLSEPDEEEFCRHLIGNYLRAHGLGQLKEMYYLRKGLGPAMTRVSQQMEEEGAVMSVMKEGQPYLTTQEALNCLDSPSPRAKLRILSPFDNAVIQRKRIKSLFDYDYQIECYVKKENRKFGYFCLPILRNNKLVARLDAKASRKDGVFHLLHLHVEDSKENEESFYKALRPELKKYAAFNGCNRLEIHKISGTEVKPDWPD